MSVLPWTPVALCDRVNGGVMKVIRTSGDSFVTGAEIADAVTTYGLALARARELDVVDIPIVVADGSLSRAQIRIGWLIDTVVVDEKLRENDLIELETIFDLLDKSRALTAARSQRERHGQTMGDGVDWDEII